MTWMQRMRALAQLAVRRRTSVRFADPLRIEPVSRTFGLDRGQPIDRAYIEQFLRAQRGVIQGRVLEIGGAAYTEKFGSEVSRSEILDHVPGTATVVADLTQPDALPRGVIDCAICTQTLNVIFDVGAAVRGVRRMLHPGGVALFTVPGITQVSRFDMDRWGDYWRFTEASLRRLLEPVFTSVEVHAYGNVATATAFLQGLAVEDLPSIAILEHHDRDYPVLLGAVARA